VCAWKCRCFIIIAIGSQNEDASCRHDSNPVCGCLCDCWCAPISVGACVVSCVFVVLVVCGCVVYVMLCVCVVVVCVCVCFDCSLDAIAMEGDLSDLKVDW